MMRRAIELARGSVRAGGGPFGCVVARDGRTIAEGHNRVTLTLDPTAHAEVVAIRAACTALGSFQLDGCTIYASCEPCPMCLGAIYWARAQRLVYACTRADAAAIGFDDDHIYREIALAPAARTLPTETLLRDEALAAFRDWSAAPDRREY
ncbi:MAG TPA: nucleoside deaminase [Planctomycetota bacterium]